ncbi:MAG: peroxidase family protein, partial [Shimia sp.]
HRDMGPHVRGLGKLVPSEPLLWQDPVPADGPVPSASEIDELKAQLRASGLSTQDMVKVAWASASSYRGTDMRGGANGARLRLAPQKDWAANEPEWLGGVLATLENIQADANVSLSDLTVLAGVVGVEDAAKAAGHDVAVPFTPGRTDATDEMTDTESFAPLEPKADGFRNFVAEGMVREPVELMIDKAHMLGLSAPEMTVLVAGLRSIGANHGGTDLGVLTERKGALGNDWFRNLLDMSTVWEPKGDGTFEGRDRATGDVKWTATSCDLVFGSNSILRAVAEVYGGSDGETRFVKDFVKVWDKVMMADRFELEG